MASLGRPKVQYVWLGYRICIAKWQVTRNDGNQIMKALLLCTQEYGEGNGEPKMVLKQRYDQRGREIDMEVVVIFEREFWLNRQQRQWMCHLE